VILGLLVFAAFILNAVAVYSSAWKVEKLNEMIAAEPLLKYDSKAFEKFVEGPRNFSTILMLTAVSGQQNCEPCRLLLPEFQIAANSWAALKHPSRMYFAMVDYQSGTEVFNKLKLTNAPVIYHFPPNEGENAKPEHKKNPMAFDRYDIQRSGESAEDILKYVETIVHTGIPMVKPPEYAKFLIAIGFLLFAAALLKFLASKMADFLKNPFVWAFGSLIFALVMTSGNMWNLIRGAPYAGRDEVFMRQFGSQYIVETRIVAAIYGGGAICLLGLVTHVPTLKPENRRYFIYGYTGLFFFCISVLFFVFRLKNGGYPFRFLF